MSKVYFLIGFLATTVTKATVMDNLILNNAEYLEN